MANARAWKAPEPPVSLTTEERRIFVDSVSRRSIEQQMATPLSDWHLMAQLARSICLLDRLNSQLSHEGTVIEGTNGRRVGNPVFQQIDMTTRSIQALTRSLQLATAAMLGSGDEARDRRARVSKIETVGRRGRDPLLQDSASDLLA
jgi:hypothetical protein